MKEKSERNEILTGERRKGTFEYIAGEKNNLLFFFHKNSVHYKHKKLSCILTSQLHVTKFYSKQLFCSYSFSCLWQFFLYRLFLCRILKSVNFIKFKFKFKFDSSTISITGLNKKFSRSADYNLKNNSA